MEIIRCESLSKIYQAGENKVNSQESGVKGSYRFAKEIKPIPLSRGITISSISLYLPLTPFIS